MILRTDDPCLVSENIIMQSAIPLPKTVAGHVRRYQAETKRLRLLDAHRRAELLIKRSRTLMQAEKQLGGARFDEILRKLNMSKRSPLFQSQRVLAENAGRLLPIVHVSEDVGLPDDLSLLCQCAKLEDDLLQDLVVRRELYPGMTLAELQVAIISSRERREIAERRELAS
jgi:hypothetical protein